jgi:hypothetical protein
MVHLKAPTRIHSEAFPFVTIYDNNNHMILGKANQGYLSASYEAWALKPGDLPMKQLTQPAKLAHHELQPINRFAHLDVHFQSSHDFAGTTLQYLQLGVTRVPVVVSLLDGDM